jgi:hypothetical protein
MEAPLAGLIAMGTRHGRSGGHNASNGESKSEEGGAEASDGSNTHLGFLSKVRLHTGNSGVSCM